MSATVGEGERRLSQEGRERWYYDLRYRATPSKKFRDVATPATSLALRTTYG
jgi:hypothetical protein